MEYFVPGVKHVLKAIMTTLRIVPECVWFGFICIIFLTTPTKALERVYDFLLARTYLS